MSVKALPRNALVEKQVLVHTGRRRLRGDDGELEVQVQIPVLHHCGFNARAYQEASLMRAPSGDNDGELTNILRVSAIPGWHNVMFYFIRQR